MALLNTNTRYLHESVVDYARRLANTLPDPLRVVFFVNSGSEANDLALRLAYAHTGRRDVLVLDHAYHGALGSQIDLSPYKFDGRGGARRARAHARLRAARPVPRPHARVGDSRRSTTSSSTSADRRPRSSPSRSRAAAARSSIPDGYLADAFAAVRAAGGLCVADEVQVGFGRVGSHFWGFELQGVVPDIVTMGKPMGNGHPLAAVVTTPEIAASFDDRHGVLQHLRRQPRLGRDRDGRARRHPRRAPAGARA